MPHTSLFRCLLPNARHGNPRNRTKQCIAFALPAPFSSLVAHCSLRAPRTSMQGIVNVQVAIAAKVIGALDASARVCQSPAGHQQSGDRSLCEKRD